MPMARMAGFIRGFPDMAGSPPVVPWPPQGFIIIYDAAGRVLKIVDPDRNAANTRAATRIHLNRQA
jgi:hypothetical protein